MKTKIGKNCENKRQTVIQYAQLDNSAVHCMPLMLKSKLEKSEEFVHCSSRLPSLSRYFTRFVIARFPFLFVLLFFYSSYLNIFRLSSPSSLLAISYFCTFPLAHFPPSSPLADFLPSSPFSSFSSFLPHLAHFPPSSFVFNPPFAFF